MNPTNDTPSLHNQENKPTWRFIDIMIISVGCGLIFVLSFYLFSRIAFPSDTNVSDRIEPTAIQTLGLAAIEALALLVGVYIFGLQRLHYRWRDIGVKQTNIWWMLAAITISVIVIPLSGIITFLVMIALGVPLENPQLEFIIPEDISIISGIGMLIVGGIVVPIAEEVFFRGVLYKWLSERWGVWIGVIISSMIFGFVHFDIAIGVTAFVLGIILALAYEYSKSLWTSVLIHAVNNSAKIMLIYLLLALEIPIGI